MSSQEHFIIAEALTRIEAKMPTKRELFAAMCLQGLLASMLAEAEPDNPLAAGTVEEHQKRFTRVAVGYADALLAELEKEETP